MLPVRAELTSRLARALSSAGLNPQAASVSTATDPHFGDYQSNTAMSLARELKSNPREIASKILASFPHDHLCEPPEIAGAGFINFKLLNPSIEDHLFTMLHDERLGVPTADPPLRIVLDFSSPNVAKPMHVGHIRSTIIGDCLARIARFLGHSVITDNHIGDWGTQFGKVIYGWKHLLDKKRLASHPTEELLRLYRTVNALESKDESVAQSVRQELVKLQNSDPENLAIWRQCVQLSLQDFQRIYSLLDIQFDEQLGESFYNDALAPLCHELQQSGIARESQGALCIFFPDSPELSEKPTIIRKGDGGFLYATTDLATIRFRVQRWNPHEIWYVVGAPQALHFQQIFEAARLMRIPTKLRHIPFGSILGEDRKIMKTRSGENVSLSDLLNEAIERASQIVENKNPSLTPEEKNSIALAIGIGAVKYAELSQNRMTDYVFSWDKMLAFQGNTAPYLQNACVRIQSIFRKTPPSHPLTKPQITSPHERTLAIRILRYPEVVPSVLEDFRPNLLANYLYELAETFHAFYEACPVLKADEPLRASRLSLCHATFKVLKHGLGLMGIKTTDKM